MYLFLVQVSFLRRERDILEAKNEVAQREADRLRQQNHYLQRNVDELRQRAQEEEARIQERQQLEATNQQLTLQVHP